MTRPARPARTLALAGLLAALPLVVLHLAGARPCVSVLSGTFPPDVAPAAAEALGVLYVVAWALLTLAAPILLLAAGILTTVLFLPLTSGRAYLRPRR
jgi:hypothetical protein